MLMACAQCAPSFEVERADRAEDGGVVHQNVHAGVAFEGVVHHATDIVGVGHVHRKRGRLGSGGTGLFGGVLYLRDGAGYQHELSALVCVGAGDAASDALACAGDDGCFSAECHGYCATTPPSMTSSEPVM